MAALELCPYVLVLTFDSQAPKSRVFKRYRNTCVPSFYTLDTMKPSTIIDSELNWNTIVLTSPPETLLLRDIHMYQKLVALVGIAAF